jgi:hypothetical protein
MAVAAQHPGQVAAHLARSRYHDFHLRPVCPLPPTHAGNARPSRPDSALQRGPPDGNGMLLQINIQMYTFVGERQNFAR